MITERLGEPDLEFIARVEKAGGGNVKKCYQCATCSTVCNLSPAERPFPRKEMVLAQWGQVMPLLKDPDLWLCYQCNDCSIYCPRGARPGDVLAALRTCVYEHYAFPSFMGRALSSPKALPLLLLVPMILMLGIMRGIPEEDWVHVLEYLFIAGNILIFTFAFISLWRFWNALKSNSPQTLGFIPSAVHTLKDILTHGNFSKCEANRARYLAHILVFFGFLGAMATAGLAALALKFPYMIFSEVPPLPLTHPIKWLGNLSGLAGFIGLTILIVRRLTGKDKVGANGYSDWLFLLMLYGVFITGLLTEASRMYVVSLFHPMYYIHLVLVFFVLWYAPYSKFAHIFYRSLALVYLRSIGRKVKQ